MKTICDLPFWSSWRDPLSGVESRVLNRIPAPVVQSFYFTNPSATPDGRYLWFYASFPPSGDHNYGRTLGVIDAEDGDIRVFPETAFLDASPWVEPETGRVYWVTGLQIWRRGPKADDRPERVNAFPAELAQNRRPHRVATHLSRSADGRTFAVDAQIGNEWFIGEAPLDGRPVTIWRKFGRCFNHAQFSPSDTDLMLIAQDWWLDVATGERGHIENRMWFIRRGEAPSPLLPNGSGAQTHEWWAPDGRSVWFVDYKTGTHRYDIANRACILVWAAATCHSHADSTGSLLAADIGTYQWEKGCRVAFCDTVAGREVNIASNLPPPGMLKSQYHIDPHPQFIMRDRWIVYTTTVGGRATLALCDVSALRERAGSVGKEATV